MWRAAGGAGGRGQLRDHSALDDQVRTADRQALEAPQAGAVAAMASRRDGLQRRRPAHVPMARGGRRGRGSRPCYAKTKGHWRAASKLISKLPTHGARSDRHRRARILPAALAQLGLRHLHKPGRLQENNRAENNHLPIRRRERKMQGFKSTASAQRFLTSHAAIYNTFYTARHLTSRRTLKALRNAAFEAWSQATCA